MRQERNHRWDGARSMPPEGGSPPPHSFRGTGGVREPECSTWNISERHGEAANPALHGKSVHSSEDGYFPGNNPRAFPPGPPAFAGAFPEGASGIKSGKGAQGVTMSPDAQLRSSP